MIFVIGLICGAVALVIFLNADPDGIAMGVAGLLGSAFLICIVGGFLGMHADSQKEKCRAAGGVPILTDSRSATYACSNQHGGFIDIEGNMQWTEASR